MSLSQPFNEGQLHLKSLGEAFSRLEYAFSNFLYLQLILKEKLKEVGLFGAPLDFKIGAYVFLSRKRKGKPTKFSEGLLKLIGSFLGSLSLLIPLVEPVIEFKDTVQSILRKRWWFSRE